MVPSRKERLHGVVMEHTALVAPPEAHARGTEAWQSGSDYGGVGFVVRSIRPRIRFSRRVRARMGEVLMACLSRL